MTAPSANLLRDLLLAFARRTALERGVVDLRAREQLRLINGLAKEIIGRKNPAEITLRSGVMAKDIAWDELKAWLHIQDDGTGNDMVRDVSETELTITFTNGSTISLKGAAEPDRLRGRGLKCVVLDEYADMDPAIWPILRPQLSDLRMELEYGELGRALFIGSPKGFNHFKKLYDDVRLHKMGDDWMAWKFTSLEGRNISANEIEKAKFDLAERDFRQEYLASFESIQGRIYHAFAREFWPGGNLDNSIHDPGVGLPISIGMEFEPCVVRNMKPCSGSVAHPATLNKTRLEVTL
jgi:hypothetical protein